MTKTLSEKEMRAQKWDVIIKRYDMALLVETGHYRIYANTKNTMGAFGKQHASLYLYHDTKDRIRIDKWTNAFLRAQAASEVRALCSMFAAMVRRSANIQTLC